MDLLKTLKKQKRGRLGKIGEMIENGTIKTQESGTKYTVLHTAIITMEDDVVTDLQSEISTAKETYGNYISIFLSRIL